MKLLMKIFPPLRSSGACSTRRLVSFISKSRNSLQCKAVLVGAVFARSAPGIRKITATSHPPCRNSFSELKQLGRVPDSVLARRFGCSIKEVVAERKSAYVPRFSPIKG
jgi:hypothetical protein